MDKRKILVRSLFGGFALVLSMKVLTSAIDRKKRGVKNGLSDHSLEKMDGLVQCEINRLKLPGAILAIVEGDKVIHYRSYGKARPAGEAPTPQTPFLIGSLTKSITALAVMQLVEAGKVELDAPVQRYLPWFHVADPQVSTQMTVRHLLNQNSGIPGIPGYRSLADFDDKPDATGRQVRSLSTLKITHPVGTTFEYSNLNYNILGLIIEVVSGESYSSYIQNHILNPLGMKHTYTSKELAIQNGLAVGSRHWFGCPHPDPIMPVAHGSLPSGQLASCAEDLAHYLIVHLNGGRYGDVRILSQAGMDELHRGEPEIKNLFVSSEKYAMGWFDSEMGQTKTIYHGGNMPDFSSFAAFLPTQHLGLVLLINNGMYGLPMMIGEVGMRLTAVLAGQQAPPVKLGFVQWIMRLLPLIPLLQALGVIATLRRIQKWRREPQSRPGRNRLWVQHILLPLVPNLSLVGMLTFMLKNKLFAFLRLFMPDLTWTTLICGGFAGIWTILRTWLVLRSTRSVE